MGALAKFPRKSIWDRDRELLSLETKRITLNDQQDRLEREKGMILEQARNAIHDLATRQAILQNTRSEIDSRIMAILQGRSK